MVNAQLMHILNEYIRNCHYSLPGIIDITSTLYSFPPLTSTTPLSNYLLTRPGNNSKPTGHLTP